MTNTILRRLRREHPQIFKSEPFLRCGGRAGETARTLQDADKPRRREHSDRPVAQSRPANRLVELLVNLELAKLRRECTITTSAARRLLDDSTFRPEILRARFSDPKVAQRKDLTFSVSERRELRDFAGGEKGFPNLSVSDKVHAAMILGTGEVEKEILQREGEDYIERGGSIVDWHRHGDHPLDKYVLNRIEAKLSEIIEKPHGALHVFIIRTIEGRAAKHEDIRSALDRLVRVGFADEFLRDVWERYPIEAETRGLPTPSEAQPVESAARKPPSKTTDIRDIRLGVNIQNILVAQSLGSRPEQPSGESDPGTEDVSSPVAGGLEGGGHSRTGERAKKLGQQTTDGTGLASRLEYVFKMNGRVWDVRFGATEQGHFPDLKGFGIIRRLLLQPHPSMPISAVELMGGDSSRGAETYTKQPQLDNEAIEKHKERLREIPGEIDEANRREELEGVEKLEIEQDCIMGILGDALNIKGKSRPLGPASPEVKARKAVHELLERVYENMERAHPPLSDCVKHFRSGIGAKRTAYAYRPTKPLDWKL